jgi:hypothetical protein
MTTAFRDFWSGCKRELVPRDWRKAAVKMHFGKAEILRQSLLLLKFPVWRWKSLVLAKPMAEKCISRLDGRLASKDQVRPIPSCVFDCPYLFYMPEETRNIVRLEIVQRCLHRE